MTAKVGLSDIMCVAVPPSCGGMSPIFSHLPSATHHFRSGESFAKRGRGKRSTKISACGEFLVRDPGRGVILRSVSLPVHLRRVLASSTCTDLRGTSRDTEPIATLPRTEPGRPVPFRTSTDVALFQPWNRLLLTSSLSAVRTSNPGSGRCGIAFRPIRRHSSELTWSL